MKIIKPITAMTPQPHFKGEAKPKALLPQTSISTLEEDVVDLSKAKTSRNMSHAVSNNLAMQVCDEVTTAFKRIKYNLKKELKPLVATNSEPNNPILPGESGIYGGVKGVVSARKKTASRDITNKKGLLEMGDILRFRIVLRESSPKNMEKLLKQLAQAFKNGDEIIEIESYVAPNGKTYATAGMLNKLAAKCNQNILKTSYDKRIPSGYPAIHIGFKTKEGYIGEIQIVGCDVAHVKHADDALYKVMDCNKSLDEEYAEVEKLIRAGLKKLTSEDDKTRYMKYRRDNFQLAFDCEPKGYNTRKKFEFITLPYDLPEELDFQRIFDKIYLCECAARRKH